MQGDMWFKHLYNFEKLIFGSAIFRFVADDCIENDVLEKYKLLDQQVVMKTERECHTIDPGTDFHLKPHPLTYFPEKTRITEPIQTANITVFV